MTTEDIALLKDFWSNTQGKDRVFFHTVFGNYLKTLTPRPENAPEGANHANKEVSGRSPQQNKSMWLDCDLIAKKMNDAGIDWKQVIREGGIDIPVTKDSVMEFMWRPVMKVMFGIDSTRELTKTEGQQDKIHEVIMRALMEKHHIEWHDFPSEQMINTKLAQMDNLKKEDYPEYNGAPTI